MRDFYNVTGSIPCTTLNSEQIIRYSCHFMITSMAPRINRPMFCTNLLRKERKSCQMLCISRIWQRRIRFTIYKWDLQIWPVSLMSPSGTYGWCGLLHYGQWCWLGFMAVLLLLRDIVLTISNCKLGLFQNTRYRFSLFLFWFYMAYNSVI